MVVAGTCCRQAFTSFWGIMVTRNRPRGELSSALQLIAAQNRQIEALRTQVQRLRAARGDGSDELWETFRLSPFLLRLLVLLERSEYVSPDAIAKELGFNSDPRIAVLRLRRKVAPWGVKIEVARGLGYYLSPEEKKRLRSIVRSGVRTAQTKVRKTAGLRPRAKRP